MVGIGDRRWGEERNDGNDDSNDTDIADMHMYNMSDACCNINVVTLQLV